MIAHWRVLVCTVILLVVLNAPPANAAGTDSRYLSLSKGTLIKKRRQPLFSVIAQGDQPLFVSAEGTFRPRGIGTANAFITVDGVKVSNDSVIDWRGSEAPVEHSFQVIASPKLGKGPHKIVLVADGSSPFTVEANSNLAIMTAPAENIFSDTIREDSGIVAVDTPPSKNGETPLPYVPIATVDVPVDKNPIVVMAAGRSYYAGSKHMDYGDVMWGLWIDGTEAGANNATYADNDIWRGAELQAPMFVQGLFDQLPVGQHRISLGASAEPWSEKNGIDKVRYRVGAYTRVIALNGNMTVVGHVSAIEGEKEPLSYNRFPYKCVATSKNWPNCPPVGQDVTIASGIIDVPSGHNGIIFISAMTRLQGDSQDKGGRFVMWLTIDGVRKGSTGVQQLSPHSAVSTRTIPVSFLTTGKDALSPGKHTVELHAQIFGDFAHLSVTRNMPIMWFD